MTTARAELEGCAPLLDWGLIAASGDQARTFLHGQLTQDIESLDPGTARLAGYCSAKGRLLASFVAFSSAPDQVWLACSADLLAPTLKRLSMFVLRMRCKLSDASAAWRLYGLAGAAATRWLGDAAPTSPWQRLSVGAGSVIRLPDGDQTSRYLLVLPAAAAPPDLPPLGPQAWSWLEVASAVPRITSATVEQFVPQMVNFEAVGGVNFQKGCYPGQEVVARSQYRGTIKRRALRFDVLAPAQAGQPLVAAADPDQPAGMVVLAAAQPGEPGRTSLLAEVKLAASSAALHLGSIDGPLLQAAALPYPLPVET